MNDDALTFEVSACYGKRQSRRFAELALLHQLVNHPAHGITLTDCIVGPSDQRYQWRLGEPLT